jgi:hypothetical protein
MAPATGPIAPTAPLEPGGQRLVDFTRQTGQYAPTQDFARTMANADRVLQSGQPVPQTSAPAPAPAPAQAASAATAPLLQRAATAAAPYVKAAGGLGLATYPSNVNTGEQAQLNKLYPNRAGEADRNRMAIAQAGRQPKDQADLEQMIREAAARAALTTRP